MTGCGAALACPHLTQVDFNMHFAIFSMAWASVAVIAAFGLG